MTVRPAAVVWLFTTNAVPGLPPSVERLLTVTELPLSCRVPVEPAVKLTALGAAEFSAPVCATCTVPAPMATPPVKVLLPARASRPGPVFTRLPLLIVPLIRPQSAVEPVFSSTWTVRAEPPRSRAFWKSATLLAEVELSTRLLPLPTVPLQVTCEVLPPSCTASAPPKAAKPPPVTHWTWPAPEPTAREKVPLCSSTGLVPLKARLLLAGRPLPLPAFKAPAAMVVLPL